MYFPLYSNPFYYPYGAYMQNMCSYGACYKSNNFYETRSVEEIQDESKNEKTDDKIASNNSMLSSLFSINEDRLEVFGISINIDDLIILIILFFLLRENQIDYSLIIILALILFDQS